MYIVLLGSPGSGKGTQAKIISNQYNIPHISAGDLLRFIVYKNKEKYKDINNIMKKGQLVNNSLIISMVVRRLLKSDCCNGFILDGFPRSINQAIFFKKYFGSSIYLVLELLTLNEIIFDRVKGRLIHPISGRIYNTKFFPPINKGIDDFTGEKLIRRNDDNEETLLKRLMLYYKNNILLSSFYNRQNLSGRIIYYRIYGNGNVYDINKILKSIINSYL
ncbi:nucleoside monophosphate kinase [Candidatus Annandia pinicola]|uniref:nucleoside monophosphate kinase n=1 Tax=Candidatus Annandia pinicola TaxID=1345117 RepID=UPI001D0119FC|nr:nucleoside monophosphate kinase [Candidatus Annandia pinicola]UDG80348.1 Adenylate kinase [Candidatus Annandia pinicola]